jgi:integrase
MAKINFYLKSTKVDKFGKIPIIAQINVNYKKFRKQIGKAKQSEWIAKSQRLKLGPESDKKYTDNLSFNNLLDKIEKKAKDLFYTTLLEKRKPTENEIRELFFIPSDEVMKKREDFLNIFEEFIATNKSDKAFNTIKGYTTILNYLKIFERDADYKLTWDTLNIKFIDSLKKYHFEVIKKQNGYYAKITRVLSTFLHWAEERNYYKGSIYEKLKAEEPEKEVIFLTLEELFTLYNYEFKNERLNKARDLYCFASFTGLRYSDVISLRKEHINGKILTKTQVKTGQVKSLSLNDFAIEILKKYVGNKSPLPEISNQKLNDYIKECCNTIAQNQPPLSGFNRLVIKKTVIGSEVIEESMPLHKAATFHTARKTFITNSIMLGVNIKVLQDYGAPKKEKDLRKYVKITDAFKSEVMDNTWNKLSKN